MSKVDLEIEVTSESKKVKVEERKALNHLIHMEEQSIYLVQSLKVEYGIPVKEKKNDLYPSFCVQNLLAT